MNDTLRYIVKRYDINRRQEKPIPLNFSRKVELPRLFRRLGFKNGAEIGVRDGKYSEILCNAIPDLKLYCVDPWTAYQGYIELKGDKGQIVLNEQFKITIERLEKLNCEIIKDTSMNAINVFPDNSLDFVFIDGNHSLPYIIDDIAAWTKKVRIGGIISGHDYWSSINGRRYSKGIAKKDLPKLCQVKDAVDCWTRANKINTWFTLVKDSCPSWMWVKN